MPASRSAPPALGLPRLPEYHRDRGERHWITDYKPYRDLLPAAPRKRLRDLSRWLEVGPLNPSSTLFREDDYWLTEERSLTNRALYHWVVTESANGHHTQSPIAAGLGRDQRAVQFRSRRLRRPGW